MPHWNLSYEHDSVDRHMEAAMEGKLNLLWEQMGQFSPEVRDESILLMKYYMKNDIWVPCWAAIAAAYLISTRRHYAERVTRIFEMHNLRPADVKSSVNFFRDREGRIEVPNVDEPIPAGDVDKLRSQRTKEDIGQCVDEFMTGLRTLSTNRYRGEVKVLAMNSLGQLDAEENVWEKAIAGAYLTVYEREYLERVQHFFHRNFNVTEKAFLQAMNALMKIEL